MPVGPPTPTAHGTPTGTKLRDGFASFVTFASAANISLWERTIKPPDVDGGEATDITTMHNTAWHTAVPKKLKKLGPVSFAAAYDPNALPTIIAHVQLQDVITVTWPDGGTLAFYGFLQKFEPTELKEGEFPLANVTIMPTNVDAAGAEQAPVYASGTGT